MSEKSISFCVRLVNTATTYSHGLVAHVDGNVILVNHRVASGTNGWDVQNK